MAVDLGLSLFTSAGILLALAVLTTILRCITRIYVVKSFGVDDYFMIVTVVLFTHYCAWVFYGRSLDQGKDTFEIPIKDIPLALKSFYFAEVTYILVTCTLKLSIGTFLLRIMRSNTQLYIIYTTMFIIICSTTIVFFKSIFQCQPASHFWDRLSPGKCESNSETLAFAYFQSAIIASSDFAFTFMPIFVVWHLQIDRFTKTSVCGLMGLGALAGVTTLLRIPYLKDLANAPNFFHATAELAMLSSVEPGLGIIIGSAAATRPLFRLLFTKYHPFISLTHFAPTKNSKKSKLSGGSRATNKTQRNSSPVNQQDIEIGDPIQVPMDHFDVETGDMGSGVKMIIEGGKVKKVCQNCGQVQERCNDCRTDVSSTNIHKMIESLSRETHSTSWIKGQDSGQDVEF